MGEEMYKEETGLMNMKKAAAWLFAGLMMTAMIPAALAEEQTETAIEQTAAVENAEPETEAAQAEEIAEPEAKTAQAEETAEPEAEAAQAEETAEPEAEATQAEETAETVAQQNLTDEEMAVAFENNQRLDATYTLALDAIKREDYEAAKEYLNICFAYVDAQSNPVVFSDLLLKRACIDVIEQKNEMALLNLEAAVRVKPDLADAYLVMTQVYANLGQVDPTIENLEKYIELTGDTSRYETVAQLQEAKGNTEAAQAAYDKFVEGAGSEMEEAGFQAGLYKMDNRDYENAIVSFEAYTDHETYGAAALYNIGVCRMNLGDYDGALEAFTECEEKGGSYEGLYYNRGVCSLLSQKWEDAAEDFAKSIETEPYTTDATYNLGICQMSMEDYESAAATFTTFISGGEENEGSDAEAATAENLGAFFYRAVCRTALGQLEDAVKDYTVCIDHQYELGQSYYQRAQIYAAMGDTEKQNADLAEALKYMD